MAQQSKKPRTQRTILANQDVAQPPKEELVQDDQTRQEYLSERQLLLAGYSDAAKSFDQAMLTLSGGALGLSIAFVKDIAPTPQRTDLLRSAWLFFGMALLVTLCSFLISQFGFTRQVDLLEQYMYRGRKTKWFDNLWSKLTTLLNILSIVFFCIGVWHLISFSILNFK